jgi:hypothetical protein
MTDFDSVKKRATLPTRTVPLCLAGEMVEQIAQLEQQFADAAPPTNIGEASPKRIIAEQIAELQDEMREATVEFQLRAMGARTWAKFWASMPTRAEKESDEAWEERVYPFYADLVSRSCVDPVMSVEQVDELVELIHGGAWSRLANQCITLNMGGIDIPNSAAASELIGTSEQA